MEGFSTENNIGEYEGAESWRAGYKINPRRAVRSL